MNTQTEHLNTEQRHPQTSQLDELDALALVHVMNAADATIHQAVAQRAEQIAQAIELIYHTHQQGGRLISFGAGTSGRLGVLDASECPPTFSTTDEFIALMAGGDEALRSAVEGAEDDRLAIVEQLKALNFSSKDCALGIAASGRTPYVAAGLAYARSVGAKSIALACNKQALISRGVDVAIEVDVGPEILTGSTRLKAGTATKMVLNMLSTGSMVLAGKVYENLMVDVQASNEKLKDRCVRIVVQATGCLEAQAHALLSQNAYHVKRVIVMIKLGLNASQAQDRLDQARGHLKKALTLK